MDQSFIFNAELIRRYDKSGPRYTSYPTAVQFHEKFQSNEYQEVARVSNEDPIPRSLSLYFHLPFCATVCFYCGCNKIITNNRKRAEPYLERLHKEIAMHGELYDDDRVVDQLHWGGGTPTFISPDQMQDLMEETARHFNLRKDDAGEYSIELDPREVKSDTLPLLRELGFNRISLGVQDLDENVQKAVNRIQPLETTRAVLDSARKEGFHSISLDLIYGLPLQTVKSFSKTLDEVIEMSPDRLAIYNYAHMPSMFKVQRQINEADLPSANEKLEILHHAVDRMTEAGYVYIGMDHFARPDDELTVAQKNGSLYRNFQGYSTHSGCDLVAMGVSSISKVGFTYCQNYRDTDTYFKRIDNGELPVFRGVQLDFDDVLRREVITRLICNFILDKKAISERYNINFDHYFAKELDTLKKMQDDGILRLNGDSIEVLPPGRLLIRNICSVFDIYNRQHKETPRFSRMV